MTFIDETFARAFIVLDCFQNTSKTLSLQRKIKILDIIIENFLKVKKELEIELGEKKEVFEDYVKH